MSAAELTDKLGLHNLRSRQVSHSFSFDFRVRIRLKDPNRDVGHVKSHPFLVFAID